MKVSKKRVLITGSQGFTGRYLTRELLDNGYEVIGCGVQQNPSSEEEYYYADLRDHASLVALLKNARADYIVHLAGVAFVGHQNVDAFYEVNLIGTRNLLSAIVEVGKIPECVLLASSAQIYGKMNSDFLSETMPANPENDYAISKFSMELVANLWRDKMPIVVVRPFNYTGVGQSNDFLLPKIVSHFQNKSNVIKLGNIDIKRDFSDVRSVVYAYRRILEEKVTHQYLNVCSGRVYSIEDILNICQSITGHHLEVEVMPELIREGDPKIICGDRTLLYQVIREDVLYSMRETMAWMLKEV